MTDTAPQSKLRAAIVDVMKQIKRLDKADENKFGHYNFTSVDDFKDVWRPLFAAQGLYLGMDELSCDLVEAEGEKKKVLVAKFTFSIEVRHIDGETDPPEKITVMLPYTGAQTTGAARSYGVKEWGKTKMLQSSGDIADEADQRRQDDYHTMRLSKKEARPLFDQLTKGIREAAQARDSKVLKKWGIDNAEAAKTLPVDWQDDIRREYETTLADLKGAEELDRGGNGAALQ